MSFMLPRLKNIEPHRHISNIGFHIEDNNLCVYFYVSMLLCGSKLYHSELKKI
jgi:hypothetical protein